MGKNKEEFQIFSIRVPKKMYIYLKNESIKGERSLNKQVIIYLKEAVGWPKEKLLSIESPGESPREDGRETDTEESEGGAASSTLGWYIHHYYMIGNIMQIVTALYIL